jgi:hypothetical protein
MNHTTVPPHLLELKVNDICLVTRNLSKTYGLANNTRVRILEISDRKTVIRVQTLDNEPKSATISRIRFKFRLPFGRSFQLTRIQFPLRLAYCITKVKLFRRFCWVFRSTLCSRTPLRGNVKGNQLLDDQNYLEGGSNI